MSTNQTQNDKCQKGNHSLIEILRTSEYLGSCDVVRWCENCGSVVVDIDFDGRTSPGGVFKMRKPKIAINI